MPEDCIITYGNQEWKVNNVHLGNYIPYEAYKENLWNNNPIAQEDPKPVKLEFKANNWPKPKKKKEVVAPNGFRLITDENYLIKDGDMFYIGCWKNDEFLTIKNFLGKLEGRPLKELMNEFKNDGGFYLASKEPRFPTNKPFPHGY